MNSILNLTVARGFFWKLCHVYGVFSEPGLLQPATAILGENWPEDMVKKLLQVQTKTYEVAQFRLFRTYKWSGIIYVHKSANQKTYFIRYIYMEYCIYSSDQ